MRCLIVTLLALIWMGVASIQIAPLPGELKSNDVPVKDVSIHVRVGGRGPAVVLVHGYGETGDLWAPIAPMPGAMHSGFAQWTALDEVLIDNKELLARSKLAMPVLAGVSGRSFGAMMVAVMPLTVNDVTEASCPTAHTGPWKKIARHRCDSANVL